MISCMINWGLIHRRTIYQMNDSMNDKLTHRLTLTVSFDWLADKVSNKLMTTNKILQSLCFERSLFTALFNLFDSNQNFCFIFWLIRHHSLIRNWTHHFIDRQTHCFTDLLLLRSHGLADTYRSANHLTDWNRNLFELCFRKTRESCNKFPLNNGSDIRIISNGNRTEWINKIRRPWSGSPIC